MDIIIDIETAPLEFGQRMVKDEQTGEEKDIGGLSPITGRVIAAGWVTADQKKIIIEPDEKTLLETFWRSIEACARQETFRLVGFSIRKFDIHFLLVRSLHHNVTVPKLTSRQIIDLREYLTFFQSYKKKGSLDDYGRLIGVGGKYKGLDGYQVSLLWKEGKIDDVRAYLEQDLRITYSLYKKCRQLGIMQD